MAKPRITRLGDPNNPYTKKKVTAAEARASARAQPKPTPKPVERKKLGVVDTIRAAAADMRERAAGVAKRENQAYQQRQNARLDSQIDEATGDKKKKQ